MEREQQCELCQKNATTTCDVCGSPVCADHNREHGCGVCGGGVKKFE